MLIRIKAKEESACVSFVSFQEKRFWLYRKRKEPSEIFSNVMGKFRNVKVLRDVTNSAHPNCHCHLLSVPSWWLWQCLFHSFNFLFQSFLLPSFLRGQSSLPHAYMTSRIKTQYFKINTSFCTLLQPFNQALLACKIKQAVCSRPIERVGVCKIIFECAVGFSEMDGYAHTHFWIKCAFNAEQGTLKASQSATV